MHWLTLRDKLALVKDTQNLRPLNPVTHRRVLIISGGIISPVDAFYGLEDAKY